MLELWLLTFARVVAAVALHPIFGGRALPRMTTALVAAAIATALASMEPAAGREAALAGGWFAALLLRELGLGAAIGLLGQAVFGAIEAAGRFVDDARGASAAQLYAPQTASFSSPLAVLELQTSLAVFWLIGAHSGVLAGLAASFRALPAGSSPALDESSALELVLGLSGELARAAMALAGPAAATCLVVDVIFGLVNRSAPLTNVFFLSLPIKLAAAVLVTALALPDRVAVWGVLWQREREWTHALLELLARAS